VDFSGMVDDNFLENLGLEKGTRKVVNHEERGRVLQAMDGCSYKAAAGGSLSNTLVALARLGSRSAKAPAINVAMTGSVGSDLLGGFYRFVFIVCSVLTYSFIPVLGSAFCLIFSVVNSVQKHHYCCVEWPMAVVQRFSIVSRKYSIYC